MAFKQVRNRASLFRPWAFGESHPLKQQIPTNHQIIASELSNLSESNELDNDGVKHVSGPQQSPLTSDSSFRPSAFRSTSLLSRTVQPLPQTVLESPSYMRQPQMLNVQEMHHHTPPMTSEEILIPPGVDVKTNSFVPSWDFSPEFPVTPHVSQLLEQPNIFKCRTKKHRPKRFQCPHCQVAFSNNGQLKGHIRIHTGERPFACDHPSCGKTFTRNEELTRHRRIHTGVRPHPCILCGKRFGRKDHLKKHVKTHQRSNVVRMPIGAFPALSYFVSDCIPWF